MTDKDIPREAGGQHTCVCISTITALAIVDFGAQATKTTYPIFQLYPRPYYKIQYNST